MSTVLQILDLSIDVIHVDKRFFTIIASRQKKYKKKEEENLLARRDTFKPDLCINRHMQCAKPKKITTNIVKRKSEKERREKKGIIDDTMLSRAHTLSNA
jgi:hypothetical protein